MVILQRVALVAVALLVRPMVAGLVVRLASFMVLVVEAQQIRALRVLVRVVLLLFGIK
jgi:hypothetical protein